MDLHQFSSMRLLAPHRALSVGRPCNHVIEALPKGFDHTAFDVAAGGTMKDLAIASTSANALPQQMLFFQTKYIP